MILASALGAGGFIWIVFGSIAGVFPRHTAAMWRLWLTVAFTFVIVDGVAKPFMNRARVCRQERGKRVAQERYLDNRRPLNITMLLYCVSLAYEVN